MNNNSEQRIKKLKKRLRASVFFRRNGLYIAAVMCLAVLSGAFALVFGGISPETEKPAEHSLDERLSEVQFPSEKPTHDANRTAQPTALSTIKPSAAPTIAPTLMPDLTPAPSREPNRTPSEGSENLVSGTWTSPVDGLIIRSFAMDCLIYSKTLGQWMTHSGVDISGPKGTEVRAVEAGVVRRVYEDDMLGTVVIVEHRGGVCTLYAGLKKQPPVKEGDALSARDVLGYIGDTAISECLEESHLHFEVWLNEIPADPEDYIVFKKN